MKYSWKGSKEDRNDESADKTGDKLMRVGWSTDEDKAKKRESNDKGTEDEDANTNRKYIEGRTYEDKGSDDGYYNDAKRIGSGTNTTQ